MRRLLALAISMMILSCASDEGASPNQIPENSVFPTIKDEDAEEATSDQADQRAEEEDESAKPAIDSETLDNKIVASDINAAPTTIGAEISADLSQLPVEMNEAVNRWIDYFTVRDPERFRRFLERGDKYRGMITSVMREQGVPTEVYYLAMIESGFTTHAKSHAKAVGIWQFMKGTAKRYGLRVDDYVDERRDPMRATVAAALYLKDLHNVFQNWYLAMAAYNAGEGRIVSAIMHAKTRDFWEMVRLKALPSETMHYIPKFLAATAIGHNLHKYGLDELNPEVRPAVTAAVVPTALRLQDIANVTGAEINLLKELNPHLLKAVTPPGSGNYRLWVPRELAAKIEEKQDRLVQMRVPGLRNTSQLSQDTSGEGPLYHTVAKGETLAKIATKYRTSIRSLRSLNKIRANRIAIGTKLLVSSGSSSVLASKEKKAARNLASEGNSKRYRVQRGDSLDGIAKRFNLSIYDLKKINRLRKNRIYAGQVLWVSNREG